MVCRGSDGSRISFEDIHGGNTAVIKAADLQLQRFLSEEDLRSARSATPASQLPAQPEVALLTGANGFLGRFLLLELLQTVSKQCISSTLIWQTHIIMREQLFRSAYQGVTAITLASHDAGAQDGDGWVTKLVHGPFL